MIDFCITSWNRFELTIECFAQIINDERISNFIILDDCSTNGSYNNLCEYFKDNPKVKVYQNASNLDCYFSKHRVVELSESNWVILADSDNIFGKDYLDVIFDYAWHNDIILTPDFAAPHFDFRAYSGLLVTSENVAKYIDKPMAEVFLNACNYFVNRQQYLDTWTNEIDPVTSDSIWFAYNWLKKGNGIYVTTDLTYTHRVHSGSHYQNNVARTPNGFHQSVLDKLKQLQ